MGKISLEEAENLKQNSPKPNDCNEVEYWCQLVGLLDPSTLESREVATKKLQYMRDLKSKIIKEIILLFFYQHLYWSIRERCS